MVSHRSNIGFMTKRFIFESASHSVDRKVSDTVKITVVISGSRRDAYPALTQRRCPRLGWERVLSVLKGGA